MAVKPSISHIVMKNTIVINIARTNYDLLIDRTSMLFTLRIIPLPKEENQRRITSNTLGFIYN